MASYEELLNVAQFVSPQVVKKFTIYKWFRRIISVAIIVYGVLIVYYYWKKEQGDYTGREDIRFIHTIWVGNNEGLLIILFKLWIYTIILSIVIPILVDYVKEKIDASTINKIKKGIDLTSSTISNKLGTAVSAAGSGLGSVAGGLGSAASTAGNGLGSVAGGLGSAASVGSKLGSSGFPSSKFISKFAKK